MSAGLVIGGLALRSAAARLLAKCASTLFVRDGRARITQLTPDWFGRRKQRTLRPAYFRCLPLDLPMFPSILKMNSWRDWGIDS